MCEILHATLQHYNFVYELMGWLEQKCLSLSKVKSASVRFFRYLDFVDDSLCDGLVRLIENKNRFLSKDSCSVVANFVCD